MKIILRYFKFLNDMWKLVRWTQQNYPYSQWIKATTIEDVRSNTFLIISTYSNGNT
jgi:hypothetical protein